MGKLKNMMMEREENLRAEIAEVDRLIEDSVERGESSEERSMLYKRAEDLVTELHSLPTFNGEL